jgi:hypothetical protein
MLLKRNVSPAPLLVRLDSEEQMTRRLTGWFFHTRDPSFRNRAVGSVGLLCSAPHPLSASCEGSTLRLL